MRKILYSPGFGAGWTSWESKVAIQKFMLEYKPIIEFLESGGEFTDRNSDIDYDRKTGKADLSSLHPILKKFAEECKEKFDSIPFLGGARDLKVVEVNGAVKIKDYDGSESYVEGYSNWL